MKPITRKAFFNGSSKLLVGGIAGVAGINLFAANSVKAETLKPAASNWPFPYAILDPEEVRERAHSLYWNDKDCGAGVFGAFVELLSSSIGAPWTNIPIEILLFGRGGGAGWGSLCGTLNGAGAIISMVTSKADSTSLINEIWGWYTQEELPTSEANAATYSVQNFTGTLPSNVSGSVLCHPSVSQWCLLANKEVSGVERKERCARLAGDIAAKTAVVLNDFKQSMFESTFHDSAGVIGCMSCHDYNTATHMECVSCHTTAHNQSTSSNSVMAAYSGYSLGNAYPNPFSISTTIKFTIPERAKVRLEIYDIKGRLVHSLIDSDFRDQGSYEVEWNGVNNLGGHVENGVYLAKLTTGKYMKTVKLSLSR